MVLLKAPAATHATVGIGKEDEEDDEVINKGGECASLEEVWCCDCTEEAP